MYTLFLYGVSVGLILTLGAIVFTGLVIFEILQSAALFVAECLIRLVRKTRHALAAAWMRSAGGKTLPAALDRKPAYR